MYDIIIIGGGPAGLTAAVYAKRANKNVVVIEKETFGGQITFSPKVENIPGFVSLSGNEFSEKLVDQVITQGADTEYCTVEKIEDGEIKKVCTDSGIFEGKTVIIATGAKHRLLGLEKEEKFIGNGISFCAVCDGAFYKNKKVIVVGGGNSALQEAILLTENASEVIIVQNLPTLTGEKKLQDQLLEKKNVRVICNTVVKEYLGNEFLTGIKAVSTDGKETVIEADGLFLAVGLVPQNEPFAELTELDSRGYIIADREQKTKTPGIFAAGDCTVKQIRQVVTAASDGAVAALSACNFIDNGH